MITDYFIAPSDAEAAATIHVLAGPSQSGLQTVEMKGIDPVVNLATLEEILTGENAMEIIGRVGEPIADGGKEGPWIYRVRPALANALATVDAGRLPDVAAQWAATEELEGADPQDLLQGLRNLNWLAEKSAEYEQALYCFWSL